MWRGVESFAFVHGGDGQEVHRVDGGFQLGELGGRRVGRVDRVRKKTIYRSSSLLVWVYEQGLYILEEVGECRTIPSTKQLLLLHQVSFYYSSFLVKLQCVCIT